MKPSDTPPTKDAPPKPDPKAKHDKPAKSAKPKDADDAAEDFFEEGNFPV